MSARTCNFCGRPVEPRASDTFLEQAGWSHKRTQGGSNQLSLRKATGRFAHGTCIRLAIRGIDPRGQGALL